VKNGLTVSVPKFRALCKEHSIKASGKNSELIERLIEFFDKQTIQDTGISRVDSQETVTGDTEKNSYETSDGPATSDKEQSASVTEKEQEPKLENIGNEETNLDVNEKSTEIGDTVEEPTDTKTGIPLPNKSDQLKRSIE
jgi:hypothetical protein